MEGQKDVETETKHICTDEEDCEATIVAPSCGFDDWVVRKCPVSCGGC